MRYCSRCILPDTRPGLEIGPDGVCSACRSHRTKEVEIDWQARARRFERLVDEVRALRRPYDCVIPVSGGKDSTWQVVKCLAHGLHPLAVTWKTPARTAIGQRNLDNLVELGVDHIDFQVNPAVERRFLMRALAEEGTTAIPMHLAIFNIPLTIAARFEAPLVVWGENSALEYVGDTDDAQSFELDADWIRKYGAVHGTTAADWVSDELSEQELTPYFGPSDAELRERGVRAVFLGAFFEWDPVRTFEVARAHGFETGEAPKTGFYEFADIDDEFISIHHWLKWYKFGFTRSYDNLSLEIRNGRMSRERAIALLRERGDETPDGDIDALCAYLGIERDRFFEIVEPFRNLSIWSRRDGVWRIDDFLVPDWPWR